MSKKQKKIFRLSLILSVLLLICVISCKQQKSEGAVNLQTDEVLKGWKESFSDVYLSQGVFPALEKVFNDGGTFGKKGRKSIKKTVIYTRKFEKMKGGTWNGRSKIRKYFEKQKQNGVIKLKFNIEHIEIMTTEEIDEFNGFGTAIWTYELIKTGDDGVIDIEDPIGGTEGRHHRSCEWEPEG